MAIGIIGPTDMRVFELAPESLLIVQQGNWDIYWALATEDLKIEFIKERIYIQSPASLIHEEIFRSLFVRINNFIEENNLGKIIGSRFPIELKDGKRAEPDILFLSMKAIEKGTLTNTVFQGSPTWIIEIVSPNYREHDTVTKRKEYCTLNVGEYWIIDPEHKTIEAINFRDAKEVRNELIDSGRVSPRLEGFDDFFIDLEEFWLEIARRTSEKR
ncbi:MAG: Uma2 family endonuclease [Candidatus Hodarchaeales archaeon]|jgi:Uma2 family endonuclease